MGGSAWSSSGGSKTCECIPNPCTNYPGCGKTYCTAMEHAEDEKHAARRSMLEADGDEDGVAIVEAVIAKNATLALGSSCDSYYNLKGGTRASFRGRYEQYGTASTSCNGKPVYWEGAEDVFLFYTSSSEWWVGSETSMRDCAARGWIHSDGNCDCPGDAACAGKWKQNTGQNNTEQYCAAASWCPDCGLWWV